MLTLALYAAAQAATLPQYDPTKPLSETNVPFIMPPKAAEVSGVIEQMVLGPIYRTNFACSEHPLGQLTYAGDALGTDCLITGGVTGEAGFSGFYKGDGSRNENWYGWGADVLAPVAGTIVGVFANPRLNQPGTMGRPPAAMIQIQTEDGVIVTLAHGQDFTVKLGDKVKAGQLLAHVGNNGVARSPHIHVGAYRLADKVPLQIRWDLRAVAAAQGDNL
jgi:hypothetical protein